MYLLVACLVGAATFLTSSVVMLGLASLRGQASTLVGITLFVILGIPTTGVAITPDLLPGFFRVLHRMLPSGASGELFRRVLCFDGAGIAPWILLIPMLGMSSSGVSAPLDMVGGFYGAMHTWVFSAQGIGAVRDALCFEDTSLTAPVLIVLGRLVGRVLLALAGTVQQKRRHLFAQLTAKEEAEVAVAAGAAAV